MADLFISYSSVDGQDGALRLADALVAGPPTYPVWVDQWKLHPGLEDWDDQIDEALRTCRAVLFVMTADSVMATSVCKNEWARALTYKKPVVPLRFAANAVLPFRLGSRQFVDFTGSVDVGLARLRQHLAWLDSPDGVLGELRARLADAMRELPRAPADRRARVEADIAELERRLSEQERVVANPDAAKEAADRRIASGLAREQRPAEPAAARTSKFVNAPPMVAPSWFQDRAPETAHIGRFIADEGLRLLVVSGRGGVGKTALVCRVLRSLEAGRLPDDGGPLAVAGIVYLGRTGAQAVSFARLFEDLCSLLAPEVAQRLAARYRDPRESPASLTIALAQAFASGPVVVLVDNLEDLVDPASHSISDVAMDDALRSLLEAPAHGLKVIVTTRVAPADLARVQPSRQWRLSLDEGLVAPHAEQLLRQLDADGSLGMRDASDALLGKARERTRGYPRALEALKAILAADRGTTLDELLERPMAPEHVVEVLVGEAFDRLDPLAQRVMQALAVFGTPVPAVAVDYLLQPHETAIDSAPVLRRLVNAGFAHRDYGRHYLHPVDRAYALARLPEGDSIPPATPGLGRRLLLKRAAGYFARTRTPRQSWRGLDDVTPQLAEFDLRCQAEDYDEAHAVLTSIEFDYLYRWGHYRYLIELRHRLEGQLSDPRQQSAQLGSLGMNFRAIGDYRQAIEQNEQGLTIAREIGDRGGEGRHLGGLANCHFALGDYRRAIELYEQALAIAREIGDRLGEGRDLGNLGNCHRALGDYRQAVELLEEALAIAREIGDRSGEGGPLGNLGNCHYALGDYRRAIELYEQALAIAREIGDRLGEGRDLGNLGNCHRDLGDYRQAVELYEQSLAIAREIGYRRGEGHCLGGLGNCHHDQGDYRRAIELHTQALAIVSEIGYRFLEAIELGYLGDARRELGEKDQAQRAYDESIAIADSTADPESQVEARCGITEMHLRVGAVNAASAVLASLSGVDYPPRRGFIQLLRGFTYLLRGDAESAGRSFVTAIDLSVDQLELAERLVASWEVKGLAHAGLAVLGDEGAVTESVGAFHRARAITTAPGLVARVLALLDLLAPYDEDRCLDSVRDAASGR